nr:unnamed protein product [Digitaria exilis]
MPLIPGHTSIAAYLGSSLPNFPSHCIASNLRYTTPGAGSTKSPVAGGRSSNSASSSSALHEQRFLAVLMAAAAMIGITTLRCHHRRLPARSRATSTVRSCTLPPRRHRRGSLAPHSSSSCSASSACSPHGRPAAALSRISAKNKGFMGPAGNGAATLHRPSSSDLHRRLIVPNSTAGTGDASGSSGLLPTILGVAHLIVSLGIVLAADKFLKQAFVAASIKFPSALFGMFCVFSGLVILDTFVPALAKGFMDFFEPATMFIQRWLPLFYVPSLVVLPLAVRDVPAASGLKIFAITSLGTTAKTCLPFLLAATVLGYMVGSGLPAGVRKVLHPIISCALSADLAAVAYGYLSGSGLDAVLGDYLTKAPSNPGAGDVLMGFLGSVIISFAFSMFKQRKLVKRHAAEIFTSIAIASTCITVALALSIVSFFEGVNSSLTAAVVVLTGLIGANFVQAAMDKLGLSDPIARGIGTASSAHGLGTAALSAKEPEALPFCAIAYGLTGIFGSLICSVPAVRQSLIFIAG